MSAVEFSSGCWIAARTSTDADYPYEASEFATAESSGRGSPAPKIARMGRTSWLRQSSRPKSILR